jgi:hypothetical protein
MSSREEIQITDLEPSIEGGEDIKYVVQIRGIDGTGRPGPWSEPLEFSSPQQIPSLESFNYVPGEQGWKLDNDGTFEVNDAFIRGELQSANYEEDVAGWRLKNTGDVEFSTGLFRGALQIGSNTFRVDSNGNLSIGGSSPSNAPFRVNTNGQILAMSIDAAFISAGQLNANVVYTGTLVASQITSGTLDAVRIPNLAASKITSGTFDPVRIPNLDADKITAGFLSVDRLEVNSVNGNRISDDSIANGKIISITANKITAGTISANFTMSGSVTVTGSLSSTATNFFPNSGVWTSGVGQLQLGSASLGFGTNVFGTTFPLIDRDGSNIRIRATGRLDMKANGGLRLEDGGIIGNAKNATGFGTLSSFFFQTTGSNFTGVIKHNPTPQSGTANLWVQTASGTNQWNFFRTTSSLRYKTQVSSAPMLSGLLDIRPVFYKDKAQYEELGDQSITHYGVIAEELHDAGLVDLVVYQEPGVPDYVKYDKIGLALIPYVKELYDKIKELERKLDGN